MFIEKNREKEGATPAGVEFHAHNVVSINM